MMITITDNTIRVGRDFVDAATGRVASHGKVEFSAPLVCMSGKRHVWVSTVSQQDTDRAFRAMAKKDGHRMTYIMSQAI